MKNFKKILMLTALVSSISGTALGDIPANPVTPGSISNPGDNITTAISVGDYAQAGVPMEVRVNVIGKGPELVLVDETGTLIENLTFDHGNKLLAEGNVNGAGGTSHTYIPQKSQVEKIVVLKRTDGKAFNAVNGVPGTPVVTDYTGNFIAMSHNPKDDGNKHQMTLTRLSSTGAGVDVMTTALDYESHDMTVDGTRTEIRTTVVSTIPARTPAKAGLYIGTGTFVGRLTVKTTK